MTFRKRLSLANAYRKGFLRIVKDTGSVAGAISLLIKTYKGHGISAVLSVLRARLKNFIVLSNFIVIDCIFILTN